MIRTTVAVSVLLIALPTLAAEVDYTEIWHTCDEAAANEGFTKALTPSADIRGSTVLQIDGKWEGQTLHIVSAPTKSGRVFCMVNEKGTVVHYKFDGNAIIEK